MTTLSMSFPSKLFGANESGCLNGRCREKKESRPGCHWWRDDIVAQGREAQLASIRLAFKQLMARQTVMHVVNKQLLYSWTNHSLMVGSDRLTVFVCIHLRWCISSSWLSFASSTLAIRIGYPHNVRQQQQQRRESQRLLLFRYENVRKSTPYLFPFFYTIWQTYHRRTHLLRWIYIRCQLLLLNV